MRPATSPRTTPINARAATVLTDLLLEINIPANTIGNSIPRTSRTRKNDEAKVATTAAASYAEAL